MSNQAQYTETQIKDGAAFMARMVPFLVEGMTFEQAGRAVIKRDEELFEAAQSNQDLRAGLSNFVYNRIRKAA